MRSLNCCALAVLFFVLTACGGPSTLPIKTIAQGGRYSHPVWSQDGDRIVVMHSTHSGETIEILDGAGQQQLAIRTSQLFASSPGWFHGDASFLGGSLENRAVYRFDGQTLIKEFPLSNVASLSWSRDHVFAAYSQGETLINGDRDSNLYVRDTGRSTTIPIWTEGGVRDSKISPSGQKVAFVHKLSDSYVVYLFDVGSGTMRELWQVPWPGNAVGDFMWSPDEEVLGVRRSGGEFTGYYLIDLVNETPPRLLTKVELVAPDWSPSGNMIVYGTVGRPGENRLQLLQLPDDWKGQYLSR